MLDIQLSDKNLMPLSRSITIDDVIDCIKKDINRYLIFLKEELENNEITKEEYQRELTLIDKINIDSRCNLTNIILDTFASTNIIMGANDRGKTNFIDFINNFRKEGQVL